MTRHPHSRLALAALAVAAATTHAGCARVEACDESCPMPMHAHEGALDPALDDEDAWAATARREHSAEAPVNDDARPPVVVEKQHLADIAPRAMPTDPSSPVVRGRALVENTRALLPDHVGNGLSCKSCHLAAGTTEGAAPFVGVTSRYPQHRARSGRVDTLADRVNDCFERSLNGRALDDDSEPMRAILAYMAFLSEGVDGAHVESGVPQLSLPRTADLTHGRAVYEQRCVACHGANGEGVVVDGKTIFPALWGDRSFNVAAGMARRRTAAGFIEAHMPLGQPHTLSVDDAWDLAGLVAAMPRPDFAAKRADWPNGGKPEDAPY